ncbi:MULTISPECIES: DUF922 domain-containing protein [unclassified Nocardioides]|uniref:DUF922 domain-containing protein n=1 Tax=unclassified Nocardioides TaxID=2615069 RepID=UPI0006F40853|nr:MULTISPECIES: DUF922 domain-containing protein [unclassified Nocardioides]KRA38810.1 hypothetical protein ASD81_09485 [Nocardioides sp. Root614]KRA92770.1 hypothetical protein ASD84_09750 [Nocardioides sp. Root682]
MAVAGHQHGAEQERPDQYARDTTPSQTPQGVLALQRAAGNGAVARLMAVQRYAVGAKKDADSATVLAWLAANSPYAPEAAHTKAAFSMKRAFDATESKESPGTWTVTVKSSSVAMTKSVDMPTWAPTKIKAEWDAAHSALRAHEALHEGVADKWKTTLEGRLSTFTHTTAASSWDDATAKAGVELNALWATWIQEHQDDQDKLDPYAVTIGAPPTPPAPPAPAAPEAAPESGENPPPIEE